MNKELADNIDPMNNLSKMDVLSQWKLDLNKEFEGDKKLAKWVFDKGVPQKIPINNANTFFNKEIYVLLIKRNESYCLYLWIGDVSSVEKKVAYVKIKELVSNLPGVIIFREYYDSPSSNFYNIFSFIIIFTGKYAPKVVDNIYFNIKGNVVTEGRDLENICIYWGKNIICYKPFADERSKQVLNLFVSTLNVSNSRVFITKELSDFNKLIKESVVETRWELFTLDEDENLQFVHRGLFIPNKLISDTKISVIKGFKNQIHIETIVYEPGRVDKQLALIYRDSCWSRLEGNLQYVIDGVKGQGYTALAACVF